MENDVRYLLYIFMKVIKNKQSTYSNPHEEYRIFLSKIGSLQVLKLRAISSEAVWNYTQNNFKREREQIKFRNIYS